VPAARRALDRIDAIESRLTVFRESSVIAHLNRTAARRPVEIDKDIFELLAFCETLHVDTSGAFDVTSTPLSRCWGFLRRAGRLPDAPELEAARALVGMRHVRIDCAHQTVHFDREGVELNFGAVGKGWALDDVARTLRADGVRNALLSAGRSSVRAIGGNGEGWHVRLTSPRVERPLAEVFLRDAALGTSGAGEQFFEIDGQRYGHVIDPRTGWPAEGALSVSVITASAAVADALSTAFFVGGQDLARAYCASHPHVLVVFTPDDEERRTVLIGDFDGADVEAV
jgi:thiamine biosynthesis lipoprotein